MSKVFHSTVDQLKPAQDFYAQAVSFEAGVGACPDPCSVNFDEGSLHLSYGGTITRSRDLAEVNPAIEEAQLGNEGLIRINDNEIHVAPIVNDPAGNGI